VAARWPATVRNLFALQPPSPELFADVESHGGSGAELERVRYEFLSHGGAPESALASGLRLARLLGDRPIDQGNVLLAVADSFDAADQPGCAARARALADAVPGVHSSASGSSAESCAMHLPQPSLGPDSR
jgi:hypothetical protein